MRLRTANNRVKSKCRRRPSAGFYVSRFSGRQYGTPRDVFEGKYGSAAIRALRQADRNRDLWIKIEGYDPRLYAPVAGVGEGDPILLLQPRRRAFDLSKCDIAPDYRRLSDGRLELVSVSIVPRLGDAP